MGTVGSRAMDSWTLMAALPVVAAIVGAVGCGSSARTDGTDRGAGCTVTVGTFNIRVDTAADGDNAWPHRIGMVEDALGGAEIWGLQEALPHQVRELSRRLPHMHALWRTRDADPARDESCPILFDQRLWALDPGDHGTFWLSDRPSVPGSKSWDSSLPRICTYARLVRRGSEPCAIYVFNVHLDHRGALARRESAQLLLQRIRTRAHPDPVVVLGDFNAGPGSPPLQLLAASDSEPEARDGSAARAAAATGGTAGSAGSGSAGPLVDAWRAANPGTPEQGTFSGWAAQANGPRIDFVLASPDVRVLSASIDSAQQKGRWPSDHLPVIAQLQVGPAPCAASAGSNESSPPSRAPSADER